MCDGRRGWGVGLGEEKVKRITQLLAIGLREIAVPSWEWGAPRRSWFAEQDGAMVPGTSMSVLSCRNPAVAF